MFDTVWQHNIHPAFLVKCFLSFFNVCVISIVGLIMCLSLLLTYENLTCQGVISTLTFIAIQHGFVKAVTAMDSWICKPLDWIQVT